MSLVMANEGAASGQGLPRLSANAQAALMSVVNASLSRSALASRLGKSFWNSNGAGRDLYAALGWPKGLDFQDYYARYDRDGIAARVVNAPSDSTWKKRPIIEENEGDLTAFEKALGSVIRSRKLYAYLKRADRLAGVGRYGVLLLGFNDGKLLSHPVQAASELLYCMPYHEDNAQVSTYDNNAASERYGLPETYSLRMRSQVTGRTGGETLSNVHWTRIIHIAENPKENDVFGTPRMKNVFNYLPALEMVAGGSAEMFWRGAFPGFAFIADADADMSQSAASVQSEIEAYLHQLQRYMKLQGMKVENLGAQVADPSSHVSVLLDLIAGSTSIPKRILIGSERGELASSQDETNWASVIEERRTGFAEPQILRPVIDRLVSVGVLPEPENGSGGYSVVWPDLTDESGTAKAEKAEKYSRAIASYAASPDAGMVVPLPIYLKKYLNFTQTEVEEAMKYMGDITSEATGDGEDVEE